MAYCFVGSMVFRQIDEEIRFYKDLMIHVLDMAVSVVVADEPADALCHLTVCPGIFQQPAGFSSVNRLNLLKKDKKTAEKSAAFDSFYSSTIENGFQEAGRL